MLRELFVIDDGISIFHYVNGQVKVTVDPVLVSGFFSAMQAFSEETREGRINRYITNKELALFEKIPKSNKFAVAIYDTKVSEDVGQLILLEIVKSISKSKILNVKSENITDTSVGKQLSKQIEVISQLSTTGKTFSKVVNAYGEQFKNIDIIHCYDENTGRTIAKYYKNENAINRKFLISLKTFFDSIAEMFSNRQLGTNYELIQITDDESHVACLHQNDRGTLVSSLSRLSKEEVSDVVLSISGKLGYESYNDEFMDLQLETRWTYHMGEGLTTQKGETPFIRENTIKQVLDATAELMESIQRKPFQTITVYVKSRQSKKIVISNLYQSHEFELSIFE